MAMNDAYCLHQRPGDGGSTHLYNVGLLRREYRRYMSEGIREDYELKIGKDLEWNSRVAVIMEIIQPGINQRCVQTGRMIDILYKGGCFVIFSAFQYFVSTKNNLTIC
jgi:hypothetical protein